MIDFNGKTAFITGSTRGIGKEIAKALSKKGANVVITGKTVEPHAKLEGTIYSAQEEISEFGGEVMAIPLDVRDDTAIEAAMKKTVEQFGGLDILINNASAIQLSSTLETPMKRFDLMFSVNVRATYACSQLALPYLIQKERSHILNLSPPINLNPKWFKDHVAYTMSKYGMSMCVLGMAEEFRQKGVCVNALWPKTTIATAAIKNHFPAEVYQASRTPEIMAKASMLILSKNHTGQFFIDEDVLQEEGETDFSKYSINPDVPLMTDLFLENA